MLDDFGNGDLKTAQEARAFLDDLRRLGMKLGLENPRRWARYFGSPQSKLRFLHVAGTNGKGSVCAMLESIYRAAGYRVGLFTSPHLIDLRERIQVNRTNLSEDRLLQWVNQFREAWRHFEEMRPTFFEALVIIALLEFQHENCDLILWETGLGGRLDATNIVKPILTIITNIGLDHQKWLGKDLTSIAAEKAGIIKAGIPLLHSVKSKNARKVIEKKAAELGNHFEFVDANHLDSEIEIGLCGEHQRDNAALAMRAVEWLSPMFPVSESKKTKGLKSTHWAGRLQQIFRGKQEILLDGAHNQSGIRALCAFLKHHKKRAAFVFGVLEGKGVECWLPMLAERAEAFFLVPVKSGRTIATKIIECQVQKLNPSIPTRCCESCEDALLQSEGAPLLVICGSLYLVGEALGLLGKSSVNAKDSF